MLKMFSTQLTGLFKRISEKNEMDIEDGARLLAQAAAGEGLIYVYGAGEMKAVQLEAAEGQEPLKAVRPAETPGELGSITVADRALIVSRYSDDPDAIAAARLLEDKNIPFVSISTASGKDGEDLATLSDVHIDLGLTRGLLPDEQGQRIGFPTSMAALFVYYALRFTIEEILEEYE